MLYFIKDIFDISIYIYIYYKYEYKYKYMYIELKSIEPTINVIIVIDGTMAFKIYEDKYLLSCVQCVSNCNF